MNKNGEPESSAERSINALATLLRIDRRTLGKLLASTKPARTEGASKLYFVSDAVAAVERWKTDKESIAQLRAQFLKAQTRKTIAQTNRLESDFYSAAEVRQMGCEIGAAVRKVICQLHLLAPSISGLTTTEIETRLKQVEDEILGQLHGIDAQPADAPQANGGVESSARLEP